MFFKKKTFSEAVSRCLYLESDKVDLDNWRADTWHLANARGFYIQYKTGDTCENLRVFHANSGELSIVRHEKRLIANFCDALRHDLAIDKKDRSLNIDAMPTVLCNKNWYSDYCKEIEFSNTIRDIMRDW